MPEPERDQAAAPGEERTEADGSTGSASQAPAAGVPERRLLSDYVSMVGFNGLSVGLSFLNTAVLLRLLGSAGYGEVYALTMVAQVITIILGGWSLQTISRFGVQEVQSTGRIRSTFWGVVTIVCGMFVVTFAASPLWLRPAIDYLSAPRAGVPFVLAYVPLQMIWYQIRSAFPVSGHQRLMYPLLCLERMVILSTSVVLSLCGSLTVSTTLTGYLLGSLVIDLVAFRIMRRMIGRPYVPGRSELQEIVRHGAPMLPSIWTNLLATNAMDSLFVKKFMGAADLGVYALGVQVAGMTQQLVIVGSQLLTPRIIRWRLNREDDRLFRYVHRQFVPLLCLWCVLGLFSASLVAALGPVYIPPNYQLLSRLVWPLAVSTAVMPLWSLVWAPLIVAFDRLPMFMFTTLASGVANVGMNLYLIPRFGAVGSGWATVISLLMSCVVAELMTWLRGDDFPRRGWRFYAAPVLLCVIALAISTQLN